MWMIARGAGAPSLQIAETSEIDLVDHGQAEHGLWRLQAVVSIDSHLSFDVSGWTHLNHLST